VSTAEQIIQIRKLNKTYHKAKQPALVNLDLKIGKGEIFGLLGPNGAGKTTTISILSGLLAPTSGEVVINGLNLNKHLDKIKPLIGIVPQEIALYEKLTLRENLKFISQIYGLEKENQNSQINSYLEMLGLLSRANDLVQTYSGGMKRRANLIAGILHKPEILFLDEPTVGVDVHSRAVILDYIKELNQSGTTIIYTSHYLEEAEKICTQVAIIDHGRIISEGKPNDLVGHPDKPANLENLFIELTGRELRD
jgi:ABC-2 type transport system ATP-binding protein